MPLRAAAAHANKMFAEEGTDTAFSVEHTPSLSIDAIGGARFHLKHGRSYVLHGEATAYVSGDVRVVPAHMLNPVANRTEKIANADERYWRVVLLEYAKAGMGA